MGLESHSHRVQVIVAIAAGWITLPASCRPRLLSKTTTRHRVMTDPSVLTGRAPVMGGEALITIVGGTQAILDDALLLAKRCEVVWSRFTRGSEIQLLNHSEGKRVEVSPLTVALVHEMKQGVALTDGDFNPTILPRVIAAGYHSSLVDEAETLLPPDVRVFESLDSISIHEDSIQLPPGMTLDAGGIGKGFAGDLIAAAVMNSGASGVMVSLSGDIVVAGEGPQTGGWHIGVENPFAENEHVDVVQLVDAAVVTSSQRKKRFGSAHHLIDPRTGESAATRVQTVSVIAATGARAEALAKSGFLRSTNAFLEWLPTVGAAGLVIDDTGNRSESKNWVDFRTFQ